VQARRAVFTARSTCEIESFDLDEAIGSHEVLIRNRVGCISPGTELAIFTGEHRGFERPDHWAGYPWWPGYCNVGEVLAVGARVHDLQPGDRVVHESSHATSARQHAGSVVPVPSALADDRAVFFKLLHIALTPQLVAPIALGEPVAVVGLGMIGNLAAQLCAVGGAGPVTAVDPDPARRAIAAACGVTAVAALADLPTAPSYVIEAVGLGATVRDAIRATAPRGRTIILSSPRETVEIDPYFDIHHPARQVIGAHESARTRGERRPHDQFAFDLLASGRISVEPLITHRIPFGSRLQDAYVGLRDRRDEWLGVVIDYSDATSSISQ
jgi:2-desacetyl-2-hydroxyethyl bacteriochlorophyllide A dehydrogenase